MQVIQNRMFRIIDITRTIALTKYKINDVSEFIEKTSLEQVDKIILSGSQTLSRTPTRTTVDASLRDTAGPHHEVQRIASLEGNPAHERLRSVQPAQPDCLKSCFQFISFLIFTYQFMEFSRHSQIQCGLILCQRKLYSVTKINRRLGLHQ